jgi:hypothetical protein
MFLSLLNTPTSKCPLCQALNNTVEIDLSSLVRLKDTKCPKLRISGVVTCPPTERQELCPKHLHDANRGQEASGAVPFSVSILHSVAWGGGEKGA